MAKGTINNNVLTFNIDSEGYFRNRPRYPAELYESVFENCSEFKLAWDCGCGNGQVSIDLIEKFDKVEATDINVNQISNSFRHNKINYTVQPAESPAFPDDYFDLICTAQSLHWFELEQFFSQAKRVLKTGGIFACWGYGFFHINEKVDRLINELLLVKIEPFWAPGNRIVQNGYKDIQFPFARINTPDIEMKVKWDFNQLSDYLNTWSAVKLYNSKFGTDIINEIAPGINKVMKGKELVKMDFTYYLGTKDEK
ncbi:MAG TPA: class I SAM-dependent methyltransferase [Bacteroidales bacterium]|nr:class I SAM-dependent methyltransferase [Bacteroidales bacterium]